MYILDRMQVIDQYTVSDDIKRSNLVETLGSKLEFDREMASLTGYATGGSARWFYAVKQVQELGKVLAGATKLGLPTFILGGGTNLLVADSGFDGLVIKIELTGITIGGDGEIECAGGEDLQSLLVFAADHSLTGLEFLAGIPGTVGGAVRGNAGAYGNDIGAVLRSVSLMDQSGTTTMVEAAELQFGYRDSRLKHSGEVVVSVNFCLEQGVESEIRARMAEILEKRRLRHPDRDCSAGCFFKNVPDSAEEYGKLSAGKLLDEVNAKRMKVGGAAVFEGHANIIVNSGNATSKDIRQLADRMKDKVRERFGITLDEEVMQIGDF